MSSPGGNELGTVFVNVAPKMSGLANQFLAAGREGAKAFNQGFTEGMKGVSVPSDGSILGEVIAGKPVGTATRSAAQKAGKEIGAGINTGIQEGMKTAPSTTGGGAISEVIAGKPASSATVAAAEKVGKDIGTGINKGIEAAAQDKKLDDVIAKQIAPEATGDKIGTTIGQKIGGALLEALEYIEPETGAAIGKAVGEAIGEGLREIPGVATGVDFLKEWGEKAADVGSAFKDVRDILADIKTQPLDALKDSLDRLAPVSKDLGINIDNWGGALDRARDAAARDEGPLHTLEDVLKGVSDNTRDFDSQAPGFEGVLGRIGGKAGEAARGVGALGTAIHFIDEVKDLPVLKQISDFIMNVPADWGERLGRALHAPDLSSTVHTPGGQANVPGLPGYDSSKPPTDVSGNPLPHSPGPGLMGGGGGFQYGGPVGTDTILGWLTPGEYIVSKDKATKHRPLLDMINYYQQGGPVVAGGGSGGGAAAGDAFAASVGDNRPYVYGGVGPGYDCSGYMSAIYAAMKGLPQGTRYFTTESDFTALGFHPGTMPGAFNVGIHRGGGGMNSHMAGTLPNGVNVESGGPHDSTLYGGSAAGANSSQFELHYYLPVGGEDPRMTASFPGTASLGGAASFGGAAGGGGGVGGAGGGGAGGGGGGGGASPQEFGQALVGGMFQELGFPDVFGKPFTQWGLWKMGSALAKYGMGIGQYLTQPGSKFAIPGSPAGLASALSGRPSTDALAAGLGGGGATTINNFDARGSVGLGQYPQAQQTIAGMINPAGGNSSATATVGGAQGQPG